MLRNILTTTPFALSSDDAIQKQNKSNVEIHEFFCHSKFQLIFVKSFLVFATQYYKTDFTYVFKIEWQEKFVKFHTVK